MRAPPAEDLMQVGYVELLRWRLTGDAGDDLVGDLADFDIAVLGCGSQNVEGFGGGAALLGHDHAEGLINDGPRRQRGTQLVGQHRLGGHPGRDADRDGRFPGEPLGQPCLSCSEEPRPSEYKLNAPTGRSGVNSGIEREDRTRGPAPAPRTLPPQVGGQAVDAHFPAVPQRGQARPGVQAVLQLVDLGGVGVGAGDGQRPAIDPTGFILSRLDEDERDAELFLEFTCAAQEQQARNGFPLSGCGAP